VRDVAFDLIVKKISRRRLVGTRATLTEPHSSQWYRAIQLWKVIDNDWWLILSGLLAVAFGAVIIAWPSTGALALIWSIAWFALFFGCMFVGLAFELRRFKRT
jgi:hypothetical protein